jgi:ATP-binding cassette subfamily C protein CydCD
VTRGPLDPRLLRHARTARGGVAALALLGAAQATSTVALAVALTLLVAHRDTPRGTATALVLLAAVFAARAGLTWAEQVVARRTAARVTDELRRTVLAAALRRGPAWVAGYGTGRLTAVLTNGLDALKPWFAGYLPALVLGVVLPPLVVIVMAVVDPASAVITLLTLPLLPVFGALIGRATQRRAEQRWAADARLAGHFLDVVRGLATLRLYGRARRQVPVVAAMTDQHRIATVRLLRVAFLSSTALDLVGTLSVGLVAVEVGLRVAAGELGLGPALLVILLAPEAYRPLREMAARYHASADANAVITDVDEVLTGSAAVPVTRDDDAAPGVTACGLVVRHPGATVDALDLPGLSVRAGEIVALRGASGAGKTTALRVLAGLQPLRTGDVRVFGPRPILLPQRPTLPHARTVRDVLTLDATLRTTTLAGGGGPGAGLRGDGDRPTDAEVAAALRTVGLDGELAGPDAPLGEHGHGVSSGQRQRLALARLLREAHVRPAVLLLDEPTAHLDAAAEQLVIARLREAADRGCAVLVAAHRPALLAAADRIVDVITPAHRPTRAGTADPGADLRPGAADTPDAVRTGAPPGLLACLARRPATAAALGGASWLAGITLTGAATWLLVRAATLPPVLTLSTAVVLVRASAVARPLLRYVERLVSHEVAFARLGAWRSTVYAALVPRVPGPALHRRGELLTRVVGDVDARIDGVLRGRLPTSAALTAAGIAVTGAFLVRPLAGAVLAAGLAVSAVLAPALAALLTSRADAATDRARAELRDAVVETVDGVDDLAGRDATAALTVPDLRSRTLSRQEARAARTAGGAAALAHLGWGAAVTCLAVLAAGLPAEIAAVLVLGAVALTEPILTLPDAAIARRRAAGARTRLDAIAAPDPVTSLRAASGRATSGRATSGRATSGRAASGRAASSPAASVRPTAAVSIRGLVAGWDPARGPALRGIDLDLTAESRVAVLGPSGSGKSTLAAVLVRFLQPRAGSVTVDGVDLRDLAEDDVRRRIGLVGDAVDHVFASTLRENLRLARPGAADTQLREVLTRVRLDDWLESLPHGLGTWLGEGASTISGGQRRRLATARALLADPQVLILDEPTEGLDEDTAQTLMADLLDAASGRTVLLLTHRLDGLHLIDPANVLTLSDGLLAGPATTPAHQAVRFGLALFGDDTDVRREGRVDAR